MTPPHWLREQRRAQARLTRTLTQLPATLDHVTKQLVSLRVHADGLARQVDELHRYQVPFPTEPIQVPR